MDVLGSEFDDVMITAWMIFTSREKQWTPLEYLEQSPKFLQAYHYALPFISVEMEADWDRKRREAEANFKKLG